MVGALQMPNLPSDGGDALPDAEPDAPGPQNGDGESNGKPRMHRRHDRRQVRVLPRLTEIIYPTDVILNGTTAYQQIGYEDRRQ